MSAPKGSLGVALTVIAIIVIAVTSVGYYQFVYCNPSSCSTSTEASTSSGGPSCAPPKCVTVLIDVGASSLTTTAYTPDTAKLVIGVNNTFQFLNNDSQAGGVPHSATAKTCPSVCPFDTGVIGYNITSKTFTITTPGTYPYFCVVHPNTMIGSIVVVAGSGTAPGPASSSTSTQSSSSTSSSQSKSTVKNGLTVSMYNGAGNPANPPGYRPDNITVVVGVNNTITWTNDDVSPHTVTSMSVPAGVATFNSGIISKGETYTLALTVPGTYEYICTLHNWMKGTVIVKSG
jgi:plastocyanin